MHEVIERVIAANLSEEQREHLKTTAVIPVHLELVSWWVRSNYDQPEESVYRIILQTPDNQEHSLKGADTNAEGGVSTEPTEEFRVDLRRNTGSRRILRLEGLPHWSGSGIYWLVIEGRDQDERPLVVTRIPLEILVDTAPKNQNEMK